MLKFFGKYELGRACVDRHKFGITYGHLDL